MNQIIICEDCGTIGHAKKKGSIILGLVLILFFILPGLLYLMLFCGFVCIECKSRKLVSINTKRGEKIKERFKKIHLLNQTIRTN